MLDFPQTTRAFHRHKSRNEFHLLRDKFFSPQIALPMWKSLGRSVSLTSPKTKTPKSSSKASDGGSPTPTRADQSLVDETRATSFPSSPLAVKSPAARLPSSAVELEYDVVSSPETNKAATQVQALVRGRADRKSAEEEKAAKLRAEAAALQQQQLMEAERKQREKKEELERRRVEQLAMEEARRKAEETHKERMAALRTKKAQDRAAEDERDAKQTAMVEAELEAKLAADLEELGKRQQAAQQALAETETAEAAVASALATVRLSQAEIDVLDEKALSLLQINALSAAYQSQCTACYGNLDTAHEDAKIERATLDSSKTRLEEELKDSEAKLAKQTATTKAKQTEFDALTESCTAAEERAAEVLLLATSEATSQAMKLQMAKQATQLRVDEQARQGESLAEWNRILVGQQTRADQTQAAVVEAKAKLDANQAQITTLQEQITAIELAETHANLRATLVYAGFDLDIQAATELKLVQERVLTRAAPPPLGTPGVAPEETNLNAAFQLAPEAAAGQPTRETLLEEMQSIVRARYGATATCLEDVQLRKAHFEADAENATQQRKNQLIAVNAEKTALEVSKAEREAYVAKKDAQLKLERGEVIATSKVIHGIEVCIRMLAEEIATCKAYELKCQSASDAASAAKAAATDALEALRLKHKDSLRMARALLESEVKVQEQKSNYTFTLRAQFEALTIQIASHPLAAEFEWKGEGPAPNKTGPQLLAENDDENKRWLAELEARRAFVGSSLEDVRSKLEAAEKHAAQESKRLADQRAQQVAVLYDLELYEEQLESRSPRAAVIQPPKRRPKDAAEGARMEALAAARRAEEARLAAVRLAATPLDCS
jgi:hypothetical protein